jgi:hypothetical protein
LFQNVANRKEKHNKYPERTKHTKNIGTHSSSVTGPDWWQYKESRTAELPIRNSEWRGFFYLCFGFWLLVPSASGLWFLAAFFYAVFHEFFIVSMSFLFFHEFCSFSWVLFIFP